MRADVPMFVFARAPAVGGAQLGLRSGVASVRVTAGRVGSEVPASAGRVAGVRGRC